MDISQHDLVEAILQKFKLRPADHYVPNIAQANFIRLFGEAPLDAYEKHKYTRAEVDRPENFLNLLVAANGIGKTDIEVLICGVLIGVIDNPYFYDSDGKLYPFFQKYKHNCKGRIISTPAAIKDTILPRILELFPDGAYTKEKKGKDYYSYFEGPRGSFDLMTYEQEKSEFESITLNFVFFDEPPNKPELFTATTSRARKGMKIGFVLTPLGEAAWLHDVAVGNTRWTVGSIYAEMEINCETHGGRGALIHENLETMCAGWSEEEKEARVHARWMHLMGQVYPMWDESVHVVDPREIPEEGTIYCVMDPHTRKPNFISWFKFCPNGRVYQVAEWPEVVRHDTTVGGESKVIYDYYEGTSRSKLSYDEYCGIIRSIEDRIGVANERIMDGRFGNTSYGDGTRPYFREFNDRGVNFRLAAVDPYLYRGHNRVKAMLNHSNAFGVDRNKPVLLPRLMISSDCRNTIKSIPNYVYDPKKESDSEKVKEEYKDPCDNIRMMSDREDWKYRDPMMMNQWHSAFSTKNKSAPAAGLRANG